MCHYASHDASDKRCTCADFSLKMHQNHLAAGPRWGRLQRCARPETPRWNLKSMDRKKTGGEWTGKGGASEWRERRGEEEEAGGTAGKGGKGEWREISLCGYFYKSVPVYTTGFAAHSVVTFRKRAAGSRVGCKIVSVRHPLFCRDFCYYLIRKPCYRSENCAMLLRTSTHTEIYRASCGSACDSAAFLSK